MSKKNRKKLKEDFIKHNKKKEYNQFEGTVYDLNIKKNKFYEQESTLEKDIIEETRQKLNENIEWNNSSMSSFSQYLNINRYNEYQHLQDYIKSYRKISTYSDVYRAVKRTINDMIVFDKDRAFDINLNMSNEDKKKEKYDKIDEYFEDFLRDMNYKEHLYQLAEQWFIDGVLVMRKIKSGNKKIDYSILDPVSIVRNTQLLNNKKVTTYSINGIGASLKEDEVIWVDSGQRLQGEIVGYLHSAIKPANNLEILRDALLTWRLVRSPKRYVFYIDTGGMNPAQAKAHIEKITNEYNSKISFNNADGTIDVERARLAMTHNVFLSRNSDKTTEVSEIGGDASLGDIDDLYEAKKTLYSALFLPTIRLSDDDGGGLINFSGNYQEVSYQLREWFKHIIRLRNQFQKVILEMFKDWLMVNNKLKEEEFDKIYNNLSLVFYNDMEMDNQMKYATLGQQLDLIDKIKEYTTSPDDLKLFSKSFIEKEILGRTDVESESMEQEIKQDEKKENGEDTESLDNEEETPTDLGDFENDTEETDIEPEEEPEEENYDNIL